MTKLTILVDGVVFEKTCQIGIWRVFFELMRRSSQDINYQLLLSCDPKQPVPEGVTIMRMPHRQQQRRSNLLHGLRCKIASLSLDRDYPSAIWHSTYYTSDSSKIRKRCVTIHDMIAERWYEICGGDAEAQIRLKNNAIRDASHIICVSEATAQDFWRFYPEFRDKTTIVHHGSEHIASYNAELAPKREFFALFVGHRYAYKNFRVVVQAMTTSAWPQSLSLRVVGPPFCDHETFLISAVDLGHAIKHEGNVSDEKLSQLYQRASCFVFPSLAEGFGLPLIEAQTFGCPVVASDIPVFREIGGDAAIFFNPYDAESLAMSCKEVLEPSVRASLSRRGHENCRRFSWDTTAEKIVELYKMINGF